jgi:thioesterase domain-containing protein
MATWQAVRSVVEAAWSYVLGPPPQEGADFFEAGGDSLAALELTHLLSEQLGIVLSAMDLAECPTVDSLTDRAIVGNLRSGQDQLVVDMLPYTGQVDTIWMAAPLGGYSMCYHPLLQHLRVDAMVRGVRSVGLADGETVVRSVEAQGEILSELTGRGGNTRPPVLVGFSYGALVAFEAAAAVERQGRPPAAVVLLDPLLDRDTGAPDSRTVDLNSLGSLARSLGIGAGAISEWGELPLDESMRLFCEHEATRAAGLDKGTLERLVAVRRANRIAMHGYSPSSVKAPVLLVAAGSDDGGMLRPSGCEVDTWTSVGGPGSRSLLLACSHDVLLDEPVATTVGAEIDVWLKQVTPGLCDVR